MLIAQYESVEDRVEGDVVELVDHHPRPHGLVFDEALGRRHLGVREIELRAHLLEHRLQRRLVVELPAQGGRGRRRAHEKRRGGYEGATTT